MSKLCDNCGKVVNSNLARHKFQQHGITSLRRNGTVTEGKPRCDICLAHFVKASNLKRHKIQVHGVAFGIGERPVLSYFCDFCGRGFKLRNSLVTHMTKKHVLWSGIECPIPKCEVRVKRYKDLVAHLQGISHDHTIEMEHLHFSSHQELEAWKSQLKGYNSYKNKNGNEVLGCHRSRRSANPKQATGNRKRRRRKPSLRTGLCCPSRAYIYKTRNGEFNVVFYKTHVGHSSQVGHYRLSKAERTQLACKIQSGVSIDRILDDIRDNCSQTPSIERIHLLEKKDLHNIIRDFNLDRDRANLDYNVSTRMWVEQQKEFGCDNPVLLYKPQGTTDPSHPILGEEVFVLVIMTAYQKSLVNEGVVSMDKVLIDSTHGTSGYDFQLTSLVTVDEFGAGCPIAMCLSSSTDEKTMSAFFVCVKEAVGLIQPKAFMSDDAESYYNGWCLVMGEPANKLLCIWHVDRAWRKNLNKISDQLSRAEVYKACRTLMALDDEEEFNSCLTFLVSRLKADPATVSFGEYFAKYYCNRPKQWGLCFRKGLGLVTNMFLESLHRKLKYCYLDGKKVRRTDKCISMIMRFNRNLMFESLIRKCKNKPTYRTTLVAKSHDAAENTVSIESIEMLEDNGFKVPSSSDKKKCYMVVALNDPNLCKGCPFTCADCQACPHNSSCNCFDNDIRGNVCKHVHACFIKIKIKTVISHEPERSPEHNTNYSIAPINSSCTPYLNIVTPEIRIKSVLCRLQEISMFVSDDGKEECAAALETAFNIFSRHTTFPQKRPQSIPHNKNIEPQNRMHSTRKQRLKAKQRLSLPSNDEKGQLINFIKNEPAEILNTGTDHCYSK